MLEDSAYKVLGSKLAQAVKDNDITQAEALLTGYVANVAEDLQGMSAADQSVLFSEILGNSLYTFASSNEMKKLLFRVGAPLFSGLDKKTLQADFEELYPEMVGKPSPLFDNKTFDNLLKEPASASSSNNSKMIIVGNKEYWKVFFNELIVNEIVKNAITAKRQHVAIARTFYSPEEWQGDAKIQHQLLKEFIVELVRAEVSLEQKLQMQQVNNPWRHWAQKDLEAIALKHQNSNYYGLILFNLMLLVPMALALGFGVDRWVELRLRVKEIRKEILEYCNNDSWENHTDFSCSTSTNLICYEEDQYSDTVDQLFTDCESKENSGDFLLLVAIIVPTMTLLILAWSNWTGLAGYSISSDLSSVQSLKSLAELPARTILYFSQQQLETYELSEEDSIQLQRSLSLLLLAPQEKTQNYADILKQAKTAVAIYAAALNDLSPAKRIPIKVLQDIRQSMLAMGTNFGITLETTSAAALSLSTLTYASTTGVLPTHIVNQTGSINAPTETTPLVLKQKT
ncbi:MAG: hypothetical protein WC748_07335 [Legionellales bacterium]|jgi:hypothetical protein